jgi:hypothetical protein
VNATFTQVNTAIYNILDLLDGDGQPLNKIADFPDLTLNEYPVGYPILKGSDEGTFDTQMNNDAMQFVVRIVMRDNNDRDSYMNMLAVLDQVKPEFRKKSHASLGGIVDKFYLSPKVDIYRAGDASTSLIVSDLLVTAETLSDTTL